MRMPSNETAICIPGPAGNIEALLAVPQKSDLQTVGIICHPHPLHGGTMHNKVVTTLSRLFSELGLINLRFNFRGVGKSEGFYGNTVGEIQDLIAVLDWLEAAYPEYKRWLAGFSFGSYISACVTKKISSELLLSVAPPVNHFDFISPKEITCPWIIVQGDQDDIVPAEEVYNWIDSFKLNDRKPVLMRMPTSTHFFHGHLNDLKNQLKPLLHRYLL